MSEFSVDLDGLGQSGDGFQVASEDAAQINLDIETLASNNDWIGDDEFGEAIQDNTWGPGLDGLLQLGQASGSNFGNVSGLIQGTKTGYQGVNDGNSDLVE
ncbi:MAG: hypothetical protein ABSA93_26105 [Streptosporangiaceae bacterium]|jgi:hypothetical protein